METLKLQHSQELNSYEYQIENAQKLFKQEQEQRVLFESDNKTKDKGIKQAKSEAKSLEEETQKLKEREKGLLSQIESLLKEQEFMQSLRAGASPGESMFSSP